MPDEDTTASDAPSPEGPAGPRGNYVVVARRYRPQTFDELVGQQHVARALTNAIAANRVGHAYLFTGARGVGKTSAARILAKALNCVEGPTAEPCNRCDICESIRAGEDLDVLEIDGASNRGIDEIRDLRQNVGSRPTRGARFKIYIIDEVHMLTGPAFNALLKTLEEPPAHVKFIFCTTEPEKIPVTILSRCQRFDFAAIDTRAIGERLRQIVDAEGLAADREALDLLARRAGGSMRDSQSLLEQLLSFGSDPITVDDVHRLLGTASDQLLEQLVSHMSARDTAKALAVLDEALAEGAEVGQFLDQIFGHFRDLMVAAAGCSAESFLYTAMSQREQTVAAAKQIGVETILAIMQILEQTIARLRYSTQGRILAELAIVRICQLEDLDELVEAISRLQSGASPNPSSARKSPSASTGPSSGKAEKLSLPPRDASRPTSGLKPTTSHLAGEPASTSQTATVAAPSKQQDESTRSDHSTKATIELSPQTAEDVWGRLLANLTGQVAEHASYIRRVATRKPNRLVLTFPATYTSHKTFLDGAEHRKTLETALREVTGTAVKVELEVEDDDDKGAVADTTSHEDAAVSPTQVLKHPMVQRAMDLFDARPLDVRRDGPKQ